MTEAMRYIIIDESQSAHCCFGYTVVDTTKPYMIGDEHYNGQFIAVCECFEEPEAILVRDALNAAEASRHKGVI